MTKTTYCAFILAFLSLSTSSRGGIWVSGGGEIQADRRNPWFLANTTSVTYCIEIDEVNFGQSHSVLKEAIEDRLAYWKRELAAAQGSEEQVLRLGTQTFTEISCADKPDLAFLFGVLTDEQKAFLVDPSRFVAITVRTEYDEAHLRGRGFIYFSPQSGPLAYRGSHLAANAWSMGSGAPLLRHVLAHELGHVFGLDHGAEPFIMAESFVETVLDRRNAPFWLGAMNRELFAFRSYRYESCENFRLAFDRELWGLPEGDQCRRVDVDENGFQVFGKSNPLSGDWQLVGEAKTLAWFGWGMSQPFKAYLTTKQRLIPTEENRYQTIPLRIDVGSKIGNYRSLDGRVLRKVALRIKPDQLAITMDYKDMVLPNVFGPLPGDLLTK